MIDSRFGLKYSFPHTLVHIVDNSMYTGPLPVQQTYDPSLFATIVVTGMPMGVDNQVVTITRSDVFNTAFGGSSMTNADIEKYGQAIEYPMSLIQQDAPVKLIRVTPEDATYGIVTIYVEWRITDEYLELRLIQADVNDLTATGINLAEYKNPERLAKATFTRLARNQDTNDGWTREVLFTYVAAGRGSEYNKFAVYINKSDFDKRRKYSNCIYEFGTVDTTHSVPLEVERFTASLINDATKLALYGVVTAADTVNVQMKKRLEGSSIMIPFVNESAIRKLFKEWQSTFDIQLERHINAGDIDDRKRNVFEAIRANMDINKFDPIYGTCVVDNSEIEIPYMHVDTDDPEIKRLDAAHIELVHDYDTDTGADSDVKVIPEIEVIRRLYNNRINPLLCEHYDFNSVNTTTSVNEYNEIQQYVSKSVVPGTMYLSSPKTLPTFNIITSINQYTGATATISVNKIRHLVDNNTYAQTYRIASAVVKDGENYVVKPIGRATNAVLSDDTTDFTSPTLNYTELSNYKYTIERPSSRVSCYIEYNGTAVKSSANLIAYLNNSGSILKNLTNKIHGRAYSTDINGNKTYRDYQKAYLDKNTNNTSAKNPNLDIFGSIIVIGYLDANGIRKFKLFQIDKLSYDDNGKISRIDSYFTYPDNYYTALDYESHYTGTGVHTIIALESHRRELLATAQNPIGDDEGFWDDPETVEAENNLWPIKDAFSRIGALYINDTLIKNADGEYVTADPIIIDSDDATDGTDKRISEDPSKWSTITNDERELIRKSITTCQIIEYINKDAIKNATDADKLKYTDNSEVVLVNGINDVVRFNVFTSNNFRLADNGVTIPTFVPYINDIVGETYDIINLSGTDATTGDILYDDTLDDATNVATRASRDSRIPRYVIEGVGLSAWTISEVTNITVPNNYYVSGYGISTASTEGGLRVAGGYSGFFDDENIDSIEFKLKYSELLVRAFRGEIDPRILSPVRVPAKFLFDAGYNTVLGIKSMPYTDPSVEDIIYASTIFTDEEKMLFSVDTSMIRNALQYNDIDVKQAMYDLMIHRVYQGIPEDKRPIGPGSGLQVYFDSGLADIEIIKKMNESFSTRFTNPNATWDIGGYVSAINGMTYTYTKRIVDNLFRHCQQYTINKPFANTYSTINSDEYTEFFPNIDTTDWDLEELMYKSGGNCWVLDINHNLRRRSQRTLYREATGTSDLLQENNMRTLSQLVYLLQNKIEDWLFEYSDDSVLASMTESVNNIFAGWVGTRVEALDIRFERDINTDGGDIVVCYVNVTFRGLILRVPIIVNVNRRTS